MDYHIKERPTYEDKKLGWSIFVEVVSILKPSHCLFIGVEAFNDFNSAMDALGVDYQPVECLLKVGSTYPRKAGFSSQDFSTELVGVKHLAKAFSWDEWNLQLSSHHSDMMAFVNRANRQGRDS